MKKISREKTIALSQIFVLVVAVFAFAWMVGDVGVVSAGSGDVCTAVASSTQGSGTKQVVSGNSYEGDCQISCSSPKFDLGKGDCINENEICCVNGESRSEGGEGNIIGSFAKTAAPAVTTILTDNSMGKDDNGVNTNTKTPKGDDDGNFLGMAGATWGLIGKIAGAAAVAAAASYGFQQIDASPAGKNLLGGLGGAGALAGYLHFAGIFTALGPLSWIGWAGVGAVFVANLFFDHTTEKGVAVFYCNQWQAPVGGENCEVCNTLEVPCSEYQCKSLGQSCGYVASDPGEGGNPFCFWNNSNDIDYPVISPNEDLLSVGYFYGNPQAISPPDRGVRIVSDRESRCLSPFSQVQFGVELDEPASCKIDFRRKDSYEDMGAYMSGRSRPDYNHSQTIVVPEINTSLGKDNTLFAYVRCQDPNGNSNPYNFVFEMCVEEGPDTTPPLIYGTDVESGSSIAFGVTSAEVEFQVNEPAECKWSFNPRTDFNDMENNMTCATEPTQINLRGVYSCDATLTGIRTEEETSYYVKCRDQPDAKDPNERNTNVEDYLSSEGGFKLVGSRALEIIEASPNDTIIKDSTNPASVTLEARTLGGVFDGSAVCYYSETGDDGDYTLFQNTSSNMHQTVVQISKGDLDEKEKAKYFIKCDDLGGNSDVEEIEFTLEIDQAEPIISRAYYEDGYLKIITNEEAECVYDVVGCEYQFDDGAAMSLSDGFEHFLAWDTETDRYIKCQDIYGNQPASASECSIELRAQNYPEL